MAVVPVHIFVDVGAVLGAGTMSFLEEAAAGAVSNKDTLDPLYSVNDGLPVDRRSIPVTGKSMDNEIDKVSDDLPVRHVSQLIHIVVGYDFVTTHDHDSHTVPMPVTAFDWTFEVRLDDVRHSRHPSQNCSGITHKTLRKICGSDTVEF